MFTFLTNVPTVISKIHNISYWLKSIIKLLYELKTWNLVHNILNVISISHYIFKNIYVLYRGLGKLLETDATDVD